MERWVCAAMGLVVSACAASAPRRASTPAPTQEQPATDFASRGLAAAAQVLAGDGYRASGDVDRGFLAPSMRTLRALRLPPRTCHAFVAIATPSIGDLDAALYTAAGDVLAEDDSASPRPVLRLCTGADAVSVYLALHAFQGAGGYALQRFERAARPEDDEIPGTEDAAASPRFSELLRSLNARGYAQQAAAVDLPPSAAGPVRLGFKALAGYCYAVLADGAALTVRLLDAQGTELALGVAAEGPAALQHCANADAELSLELSATGQVRLARLFARQADVGGSRSIWLGEPAPAAVEPRPIPPAVAPQTGACAPAKTIAQHQRLAQGAVWEAALSASTRCAQIDALLFEGLARATLRVEDAEGATLAEREISAASGSVHFCAKSAPVRVSLLARAGFGAATLTERVCRD